MKKAWLLFAVCAAIPVSAAPFPADQDPEVFTAKNALKEKDFAGLFPPGVKTVAVISPATTYLGKPLYRQGLDRLLKSGLKIKVGAHVLTPLAEGQMRVPVEDRLADFYAAWNDPEVDFILCMRGGEGCEELLQKLDWNKLAPRPGLYLQGYSDVTQIICAMQGKKAGHPVAGPMVGAMACLKEECLREMADMHHGKAVGPVALTPVVPGDCEGLPLAGHLERLCRIWKSPCPPETKGCVLFIEYVNGSPEKVRRYLQELLDGGFFRGAAGVVFGQFVRCGDDAEIQKILTDFAPKAGIPVYCGFPFGHTQNCYTIDFFRRCAIRNGALTFPEAQ